MPDIGVPAPALQVGRQRVLRILGIVGADNHRGEVRIVINDFGERVRGVHLEALGETLLELHEPSVINGIGGAVKQADAAEVRIQASGMAEERQGSAVRQCSRGCHLRKKVDVAR